MAGHYESKSGTGRMLKLVMTAATNSLPSFPFQPGNDFPGVRLIAHGNSDMPISLKSQ